MQVDTCYQTFLQHLDAVQVELRHFLVLARDAAGQQRILVMIPQVLHHFNRERVHLYIVLEIGDCLNLGIGKPVGQPNIQGTYKSAITRQMKIAKGSALEGVQVTDDI